jgi:hypothetical protein
MIDFKIQGKSLRLGVKKIDFDYPIEIVLFYKGVYLVLLDPDSHKQKWGQFPNLFALSPITGILWVAELPTTNTGDSYHSLGIVNDRINAYSWCSYECFIDPNTGKIIEKTFTK